MAHSNKIILISDQEIIFNGETINMHDILTVHLGNNGEILEMCLKAANEKENVRWLTKGE